MTRPGLIPPALLAELHAEVQALLNLYRESARLVVDNYPQLLRQPPDQFAAHMQVYARWICFKICVEIARSDARWNPEERELMRELIDLLEPDRLHSDSPREALTLLLEQIDGVAFSALLLPFARIKPLRDNAGMLEANLMRIANIVTKLDGRVSAAEVKRLQWLQGELQRNLDRPIPLAESPPEPLQEVESPSAADVAAGMPPADPTVRVQQALHELDALVGLNQIKQDVRELINFLRIQQERQKHGLNAAPLSLHMVFTGNPGTGKTTVARILGTVLGALQVVSSGHLIETDRSGLVAGYLGQTGSKAHKKIDEARDGILFIDEAYTLIAEGHDDPYGHEAVQALLKRMEDERDRLIVILAGYSAPMQRLLRANPGLSSRFHRTFEFLDYTPGELLQIFLHLADKHHYRLPQATRARFLLAMRYLTQTRDEHFGNGRLVRNIFEASIRRLANRIASIAPLSKEILTRIEPQDLHFAQIPPELLTETAIAEMRLLIHCPSCQQQSRVVTAVLARRVRCRACSHHFRVEWAEPDEAD